MGATTGYLVEALATRTTICSPDLYLRGREVPRADRRIRRGAARLGRGGAGPDVGSPQLSPKYVISEKPQRQVRPR